MKKFFKYAIFILMAFVMLPLSIDSKYLLKSNAVGDNNHIVNFYDYTNSNILYSINNVPSGYTLDDLDSSNIVPSSDSYFGTFTTTTIGSGLNGFDLVGGSTFNLNTKMFKFPSGVQYSLFRFIVQNDVSSYFGKRLYFKFRLDNLVSSQILYAQIFYYYSGGSGAISSLTFNQNGLYELSGLIPSNALYFDIRLVAYTITSPISFKLEYINVSMEDLPYYNQDYLKSLFEKNSPSYIEYPYYWYTDLNFQDMFTFLEPITTDLNLYSPFKLYKFYAINRIDLIYSKYILYGSPYLSYKQEIINSFCLFYDIPTSDVYKFYIYSGFYNFDKPFTDMYRFLDITEFYCDYDLALPQNSNTYEFVSDNNYSDNLLNSINLESIKFNYRDFNIAGTYISTFTSSSQLSNIPLGVSESYYNDLNGNIFHFVTDCSVNFSGYYVYTNYISNVEINSSKLIIPFCDYSRFSYIDNGTYRLYSGTWSTSLVSLDFYVDIDFGQLYYYSNSALIGIDFSNIFGTSLLLTKFDYILTDNTLFTSVEKSLRDGYLVGFESDYLLSVYPKSVYVETVLNIPYSTSIYSTSYDEFISRLESSSLTIDFLQNSFAFRINDSDTSTGLIPTTSTGLYREKKNWYDFGTDLYNFVIYLLFDAPIVSNFTKLIYIIIALIIRVIEIIIGFFTGVSNNIFLTAILGFLILRFIISLFFNKGGE